MRWKRRCGYVSNGRVYVGKGASHRFACGGRIVCSREVGRRGGGAVKNGNVHVKKGCRSCVLALPQLNYILAQKRTDLFHPAYTSVTSTERALYVYNTTIRTSRQPFRGGVLLCSHRVARGGGVVPFRESLRDEDAVRRAAPPADRTTKGGSKGGLERRGCVRDGRVCARHGLVWCGTHTNSIRSVATLPRATR